MDDLHLAQIAKEHIGRSLSEAEDIELRERWASGQRADEQATDIVSQVLAFYAAKLKEEP